MHRTDARSSSTCPMTMANDQPIHPTRSAETVVSGTPPVPLLFWPHVTKRSCCSREIKSVSEREHSAHAFAERLKRISLLVAPAQG